MFLHPDVILHMEFLKMMKRSDVCVCVCVLYCATNTFPVMDLSVTLCVFVFLFLKFHLAEILRETRARLLWRLRCVLVFRVAAEVRKTLGMMDYNAETLDQ